jgi:hypothetical protein
MGGSMEALPTWQNGVFSRILRDAAAAVAQQSMDAAALWVSVFGDAERWFDPDPLDASMRPTEVAAIKNVFHQARNAQSIWTEWLNLRDEALYNGTLDTLADNVKVLAAIKAAQEEKAARRAELKAIKDSQLRLPPPLGVAA